jgi:hypothetical protein
MRSNQSVLQSTPRLRRDELADQMSEILFYAGREDGLKMRALFFARDNVDFDVTKAARRMNSPLLRYATKSVLCGIR